MPTSKSKKSRCSKYDQRKAKEIIAKYADFIPGHYIELIQNDMERRGFKNVYSNSQIYEFKRGKNFHREICISFENVGKKFYDKNERSRSTLSQQL